MIPQNPRSYRSTDRLRPPRSFFPASILFCRHLKQILKFIQENVRSDLFYIGSSILFSLLYIDVVIKQDVISKTLRFQAALSVLSNARRSCLRPIARSRSLDPRGFLTRSTVDIHRAEQRLEDHSIISFSSLLG